MVEELDDERLGGAGGSGALPGSAELGLLAGVVALELLLVLELRRFNDERWLIGRLGVRWELDCDLCGKRCSSSSSSSASCPPSCNSTRPARISI